MTPRNRLAAETSPYLRQHADNPVDWYPWGDEAFEAARERDRPILLSIGYSACHWCHVMAHESFEDPVTATRMNELFVNVKVDREERPDVDAIYMDAVQALTGHGGWPLTVFLTPDGRPFFGGTYFPKHSRGTTFSFGDLCARVDELWRERRDDLNRVAAELTESISRTSTIESGDPIPDSEALDRAVNGLVSAADRECGGFGSAPKFPQPMNLELLLSAGIRHGSSELLEIATTTLDAMSSGGIYDHLGGGFARYSTDRGWLVPHFEKMLYDQALLTRVYLHAWQITGNPVYRQVVEETIDYVMRDLRHAHGGFFSAEDADSDGVEGRFYVWSIDELREVLGDEVGTAAAWYGATREGNFEGANILFRPLRGDLLRSHQIERARHRLFEARLLRTRPGLDDKVLTEWNGLMVSALCEAAAATGNAGWLIDATATADFLCDHLRDDTGRWLRSWQGTSAGAEDGRARHLAYASDYAALIDAFTRLGEVTGEARWIGEAREVASGLLSLFWDDERGGVFTTGRDAPELIARPKEVMDSATPSANSLAALGLLRLAALTGSAPYRDAAETIIELVGPLAVRHPQAFGHLLAALDLYTTGITEVAVTGDRRDLVEVVQRAYHPDVVLAWGERYDSPLWEGREIGPDGSGLAHVCRDYTCKSPAGTVEALSAQLAP